MNERYDVAAYVWPAYTGDEPRTRMFWPEGIGEWQSVKNAVRKFPEHDWPRKPLWGYVNEADPYVMEMQIQAAADHGVNVFIYDWYWYDRRPFLEQCLNNGYLKARNNDKVKFYLMWANHPVNNTWDIRLSHDQENLIWDAAVDRTEFENVADRLIERYFQHPSYYKIGGKPVFMIYDLATLMKGLGGAEATREAFEWFRGRAVSAGLPGLHLQLTMWKETSFNLSGVDGEKTATTSELAHLLGFDSLTHYQFVHFVDIDRDYGEILPDVEREWERIDRTFHIPYFPHVSIGWDNNPRFQAFRPGIVKGNTPEMVKRALEMARNYADAHPGQPPLITINSWNEWTETSYLQPDDLNGYGYLEAVKAAFVNNS
ncbi:glycoside hydrolase family 99-like domain-containing protein [Cohnella zeiphila]|uniref:Glycoside hydrolase family 99-like domain-containing protein n=1 Tax=Cohnella zeiphila TaxID=2761120 RepID=A0A7X0SL83_9BACL|nr:glycoside hydrolase family 99-like domain-containing protein [Cohnella zeiphila]MBB6730770.1 glycoside hydrolase family 99-like domain-containing protein [Cohnella zeiphila]